MINKIIFTIFILNHFSAFAQNHDMCFYLSDINNSIDIITNESKLLIKSDDSCVISMLDSLSTRLSESHNEKYYFAIAAIGQYSEGYLSEYFISLSDKLYKANSVFYLSMLYSGRKRFPEMEYFFITSSNGYINNVSQRSSTINELDKLAKDKVYSKEVRKYIHQLNEKIVQHR